MLYMWLKITSFSSLKDKNEVNGDSFLAHKVSTY